LAKLGDIFLNTVYEEKPDKGVKISDHPIEDGSNITDHVQREPLKMNISGVVAGSDASTRLSKLKAAMDKGQRLKYVYRNVFDNVVIESLQTTHDVETKGAFKFTMTLKQIQIAQKATVIKLKKPVTSGGRKQPAKPSTPPKKVYVVVRGDNLTKIGRKYEVSWQTIYNKNKGVIGKNPNLIYPGQKLVI